MTLKDGIVREHTLDGISLVLWLPGKREQAFLFWDRIKIIGPSVPVRGGFFAVKATSIPARQPIGGFFLRLFQRLRGSVPGQLWTLPDGRTAEQCGAKQEGLLLVWAEDDSLPLDESHIQLRWPENTRIQRVAESWFLVWGVKCDENPEVGELTTLPGCPRAEAERHLTRARAAGDRDAEASALTDLGVMSLAEGDASGAMSRLEEALAIAHLMRDRAKEADILGNLGVAFLGLRQPERAQHLFETQLAYAREARDPFAEKNALERLGFAYSRSDDSARAIDFFQNALALARSTGDLYHQSTLLWCLAVEHAELGQRDQVVTMAFLAIDLKERMHRPDAQIFRDHLHAYRSGANLSKLRSAIAVSVMPVTPSVSPVLAKREEASDPGLLRKASSAAKAAARLFGSGLKMVSREIREERLRTCAGCVHHTGLRCRICGCFTNLKSRMPYEMCPLGKWMEYKP